MMSVALFARNSMAALGRRGVIAIGLAAFCIGFYASVILPMHEDLSAANDALMAAGRRIVAQSKVIKGHRQDQEAALARFYHAFPKADAGSGLIKQLNAIAATHKITLRQGDYLLVTEPQSFYVRDQVNVSATGSYLQIRSFIANVLKQNPYVSLDDFSLQRKSLTSSDIDAQLQFSLFLRK